MIRQDMKKSLDRYVDNKLKPGGFLTAVLENDLVGSLSRADVDNLRDIKDIVIEARHDTPKPEFSSMHEMLAYVLGQEDWARKMNLNIKEKKRVIKK